MARHIVRAMRNMNRENTTEEGIPLAQPHMGPYPQFNRWENLPEGATSNAEVISILESDGDHTRNLSYVYGIGTQQIEANQHYDAVHIYKDGHIDRLVLSDGEHKIWDGAYAAAVMANKDAVIYINGHVGTLVVSATAQVIIGHGAYIDSMQVMRGGMARIEDDAAVCNLRVYNGGRCMINDEVRINRRQYDDGSIVGYLLSKPDKECPLYVSMAFHSLAAARNCSAALTTEYRDQDDTLHFGNGWSVGNLHHCQLHLGTLSFYADYVKYNRKEEEPIKLYQAFENIYKQFLPDDDEMPLLEVVLNGKPIGPNAVAVCRFLDEEEDEPVKCSVAYDVEEEDRPVRMADTTVVPY